MAESTLGIEVVELKAAIGQYLGYGRGATTYAESAWTTAQTNDILDQLKTGLNWFYVPSPIPPGMVPHSWSFLRPVASLTMVAGTATVDLPDDFGYFEGNIYITTPATAWRRVPLELTNEGVIQSRYAALPDTTGAPRLAALEVVKGTTATEGTRYRLHVWPTPDAAYVLHADYKYLPDMLSGTYPYPPGGAEHGETIRAACVAAAELYLDNEKGAMWQNFVERLAASIAIDNRKKGWKIGYNGDRSDHRLPPGRSWRDYDNPPVTYNGDPL